MSHIYVWMSTVKLAKRQCLRVTVRVDDVQYLALPAWTLAMVIILLQWRPWLSISHNAYFGKWLQYSNAVANTCTMRVCIHAFLLCLCTPSYTCLHYIMWHRCKEYIFRWGGGVCVSEKYGFKAAWFYLFVVVMIEHLIQQYTNTHSWTLCRFFFFHTQPQTCASRHIDTTTHTRRHTNTHWRIYGSSESGLLMERLPLINASFNDSLLKTGGRVIVCFSSSRAGKKWNDVEIYDICSPVRQNY